MSTPINPLDRYRQYSYQHYLFASNNTEAVRLLQESKLSPDALSKARTGELLDLPGSDGKKLGGLVSIINPVADSEFFIESLNYTSYFADPTMNLTVTTEMKMKVREPKGIRFLNVMQTIFDDVLKCSYSGTVFVLKTLFVGHLPDGGTEYIENIQPISLVLRHISAAFDSQGGVYELEFAGLSAGAPANIPTMKYVDRNRNYVTDGRLEDLIKDLEKKLNQQTEKEYSSVGQGRRVRYRFTIPDSWKSFSIKGGNADNHVEGQTSAHTGRQRIAVSPNLSIPKILDKFFEYCPEIKAAGKLEKGKLSKLHKIVSGITSNSEEMVIHYDVVEYIQTDPPDISETPEKYGIVYDYYFSGKNTDILKFDLNLKDGLLFLNRNVHPLKESTNLDGTAEEEVIKEANKTEPENVEEATKDITATSKIRENDPVLPSSQLKSANLEANKKTMSDRQSYLEALAKFSTTNLMNIDMEIRGNPFLMGQVVRPLMPHEDGAYESALRKREAEALTQADNPSTVGDKLPNADYFEYLPIFVKVNIFTPAPEGSEIFAEPFWYNGWFRIMKIEHTFNMGEFKQKLHVNANDIYEKFD